MLLPATLESAGCALGAAPGTSSQPGLQELIREQAAWVSHGKEAAGRLASLGDGRAPVLIKELIDLGLPSLNRQPLAQL